MLMLRCFFGFFGVLKLALVDCASYVAYVLNIRNINVTFMPGLCCFHGCFYGLDYVMFIWFEFCDCLCSSFLYIYACFYATSMGHYLWYIVPCNERSLSLNDLILLLHQL
jgi:hypothetical protein